MQKPLAKAELAIMELLWKEHPMSARQIREKLYADSSKAQHGTVQRLMQRLVQKGYVSKDASQMAHQFTPTRSRQDYAGEQLERLAGDLTSGSFAPMITHLVENRKITKADLAKIRKVLDEAENHTNG